MNIFNVQDKLQHFLSEDDGNPIVILNLLRFAADGGRERWAQYTAAAGPIIGRYGAEMVFVGDTLSALSAAGGPSWDAVALIRYPNRQAFANLANDADYRDNAAPLREAALQGAVVQPVRAVRSGRLLPTR